MINSEGAVNHTVKQGCAQLVCEAKVEVKPPMSKIVGERFNVKIVDYTTFTGKVLVKGIVKKSVMYLHPHLHKKDEEKDCDKRDDTKKDGKKSCREKDGVHCTTNSCKLVDSVEGIVHFMELAYEFTSLVEVPGVKSGDVCHIEAKVKDVGDFIATERDKNGLVTEGKEVFIVDVKVSCKHCPKPA